MRRPNPDRFGSLKRKAAARIIRWPAAALIAAILVSTAAASDGTDPSQPAVPPPRQAAIWLEAESASQNSPTPQASPSAEPPSSVLDRRDRVFYPGDTERLKPLGRKLVLNILLDQKEIFTSPFHIDRNNAKWWLIFGTAAAGLIASDRRIANSFENSRGQVQWGGRISNIGASYTVIPIVAGTYGYGVLRDNAKAREIGVLGTESLLDGLIVVGVLKEVTRRDRPDDRHPGDFWAGGTSFPSGHAIQVWSIASLLSHEYQHTPLVGIAAYSLAGIVSAARIAAEKHFASDVVVGGAMGWFIGRYVYQTHMSHLAHKHAWLTPMIAPQFDPLQRTYGATLVFGKGEPPPTPNPWRSPTPMTFPCLAPACSR